MVLAAGGVRRRAEQSGAGAASDPQTALAVQWLRATSFVRRAPRTHLSQCCALRQTCWAKTLRFWAASAGHTARIYGRFYIFYATHVLHALREDGVRHTRCSQLTLLAIRLTLDTRYQLTDTPEPRFTQHFTGYGR